MGGNFYAYVRSQHTEWYRVSWKDTPISGTNKSEVKVSVRYYSKWKTKSTAKKDLTIWINGTKYTGTAKIGVKGYSDVLMSKTKTITHNSNGKKKINIRFRGDVKITYTGKFYDHVDTGNLAIDLTPLANTPSAISTSSTSVIPGNKHTCYIKPRVSVSGLTHTVVGKCSGYTWTIASKTTSKTIEFTLPTAVIGYMDAKSEPVVLTCTTYVGSKNIGSTSCKFTSSLSSSTKPSIGSIGVTVAPSSAVTSTFVQGKSKARLTFNSPSMPAGAKLKHYEVNVNGSVYYTTNTTFDTAVLNSAGTNKVSVRAVDTRGCVSSAVSKSFTVESYNIPIIKSVTANRHNGSVISPQGTKLYLSADWALSSAGGHNKTKIEIFTKLKSESSFGTAKKTVTDVITFNGLVDGTYDINKSYDVKVVITDTFGGSATYFTDIDTEEALIDLSPYGLAVGKVFEGTAKQFQCQYPAVFQDKAFINGTTAVTSDARMKDVIEPLQPILEEIWEEIGVYTFKYKQNPEKLNLGVIAQDVIKIFESHNLDWKEYSLVIEENDQYYVNYEFLHMITMYVVQQLQIQMVSLTTRLDELERRIK